MLKPLLLCATLLSPCAFADWQLSNTQSDLSITSIKKNSIAENHYFKQLEGTLSDKGMLTLSIDLASIETMIPIRNERMQKMLFDVANFPKAIVRAELAAQLESLKAGVQTLKGVPVELSLHGEKQQMKVDLVVNKQGKALHVTPQRAILVKAADFKLTKGVEALRKVAGLDSIATTVPVTFSLVFDEQAH